MFQIGDLIVYGSYGVCKVEAVGTPDIPGVDKSRIYYTLCSVYQESKIFTPVDTAVFMRPVITGTKVQQLIDLIPSIQENIYENQNQRLLEDHYKELLQTHDCSDLIEVIKTVYAKKTIAAEQGKKLGQTDERFMKKAEDLLNSEFALALDIPKNDVKSYIENRLQSLENDAIAVVKGDI